MIDTFYESGGKDEISNKKRIKYEDFQEKMDNEESNTRKEVCQDAELIVLNQNN